MNMFVKKTVLLSYRIRDVSELIGHTVHETLN